MECGQTAEKLLPASLAMSDSCPRAAGGAEFLVGNPKAPIPEVV